MKKQLLLAAAAATALVAAGSANAASLSYRAGAGGALNDTTAVGQYLLARELNFGAGVTSTSGQFDTVVVFNGTGVPAGTYNFTVTYDTGATFNANVSTATVTDTAVGGPVDVTVDADFVQTAGTTGSTLSRTSGGTTGSNTVTYTLFVPAGATVQSIAIAAPLRVTGAVRVTSNIINQTTNTPFEPGFSNLPLINVNGVGFASRVIGTLDQTAATAGADEDTRIIEGAGAFNTLAGIATAGGVDEVTPFRVGQFQIAAASAAGNLNGFGAAFGGFTGASPSPIVFKDLNGTAVALTDVVQSSVTIQGLLSRLVFSVNDSTVADGGTLATGVSGVSTVTTPTTSATNVLTNNPSSLQNFRVALGAGTAQLNPTELAVTSQLFLGTGFVNPAAVAGNFEQLQSDGFTYIIPWVSSATQAGSSGNQTIIRISKINPEVGATSASTGRVYAHLINPVNRAGVTQPGRTVLLSALDANNELIVTSATLEAAFGNFQRADVRLVITSDATTGNNLPGGGAGVGASDYVVKRLIANTLGGLTEMEIVAGANGSVNNLPVNQASSY